MSYKKFQQDLILDVRKMFVITLCCGVLSVCLPQYFNYPLLSVILPVVCMAVYTRLGYMYSEDSPLLEQFADSVYYLGFLLTLVALVISLYFYQSDTVDASLLTTNFSLALITTIFGLAVRIFINNFQLDLDSIERQMMSEVEHAANDMIRKAKLISMQLDVSHQETQIAIKKSIDHAAEGIQQAAVTIEKYAQNSSTALQQNAQASHQSIINIITAFEENIRNMQMPEQVFAETLKAPLQQLVTRLDETQGLLKQLNDGQREIAQSTQQIAGSTRKTVAEVDVLSQSISVFNDKLYDNLKLNDDFARVIKEISTLSEQTGKISVNLEQQTEQSGLAMQNFTKLVNAVHTLPDELESIADQLRQSSGQLFATFHNIGDNMPAGASIGSDLQHIAEALSNTKETVKQISDFGVHVTSTFKRLENFNQLLEKHTQLLADMGGVAQLDIDLAKQHQTEMAQILKQSRESQVLMQQDLINSMQQFKRGLKG